MGYDDQRKGWKCCDHELSNSKQIEKEVHEIMEDYDELDKDPLIDKENEPVAGREEVGA